MVFGVFKAGSEAKFWLSPEVQLARNDGFDARMLRRISSMVVSHREVLEEAWHEYFA
ncbi:DUF4160 domain-containing protein [Halomonas campisalis]|uniref:DUF4160 domain-containing protein n=1 Tax=Billgrantia campisalis TaxID=74661 RepID=A0ABS9P738_9GAMM|nr:DUF4160 domain-containing protein [Halomonas campisalis]